MMVRRPPKAPMGMPPPMTLPNRVRSGLMPHSDCAPPRAARNPVITSSKIRTLPYSSQRRRRVLRKRGEPGTQFMLPATGSTMTAATCSPASLKTCSACSALLNSKVMVCFAVSAGTPGEVGTPRVSAPEPALTNSASAWPW